MSSEVAASASTFAKDDNHESKQSKRDPYDHDEDIKQCRSAPICSTKFIPPEIVACILPRLPAKSIGRFRCVCRQWRSLTHDPRFVDEHRVLGGASGSLRLMASAKTCWKTRIQRLPPMSILTLPIYEIGPNCDEIKHGSVHIKFDDRAGQSAYVFSNCVNGLIGVIDISTSSSSDHFLLNPITLAMSRLPRPRHMVRPSSAFYGLGFDASRGAYKLVFVHPTTVRDPSVSSSFTVLTVGTRTCRPIGYAPLAVRSRPVFLHGAIYWLANTSDHHPGHLPADTFDHHTPTGLCILAFDVEHETMRLMPAPEILALTSDHISTVRLCLRNLEGHICIVEVSKLLRAGMRIWMITDHASPEWKPRYEIDIYPLLNQPSEAHFAFDVLGILDGQVLIQSPVAIYSYDLHGRTLRKVFCGDFSLGLDVVTESLISPRDLIGMNSM